MNKQILIMQDFELIELLDALSELFGTKLREGSFKAFIMLLKQRFPNIYSEDIKNACIEWAANPVNEHHRFTPAFLSMVIQTKQKDKMPKYEYRESTQEEREYYKEKFFNDLYSDFDDYCKGKECSRIFVWAYVCKLLKRKGFLSQKEYDNAINRNDILSKKKSDFKTILANGFEDLALSKFKDLAMTNKHISEVI